MPLTPAHAAAVVPLRQWKAYFWLSPLVVGSMAPDYLYYFFPPDRVRHFGHTLLGLFVFCIPAGLLVLFAFHSFYKRPLVLLMPRALRAKLWPYCGTYRFLPMGRFAWIIVLIFFGAVTHVVWDGVTHENGWAVSGNEQLGSILFTIAGHSVATFGLLQYGSSFLGLGLLAWWSWRWYQTAPVCPTAPEFPPLCIGQPAIVAIMLVFASIVGIAGGWAWAMWIPSPFPILEFFAKTFIAGIDGLILSLSVFGVSVNFRHGRAALRDAVTAP